MKFIIIAEQKVELSEEELMKLFSVKEGGIADVKIVENPKQPKRVVLTFRHTAEVSQKSIDTLKEG